MAKKVDKRPTKITEAGFKKAIMDFNSKLGTTQAPEPIPKEYRD